MDRTEQLKQIFYSTGLPPLLKVKAAAYYQVKDFTALRFHPNDYRIRSIEIWDKLDSVSWFRIYHSDQIATELKQLIDNIEGFKLKASNAKYSDFYGDPQKIAISLGILLAGEKAEQIVRTHPVFARNSAYEGLILPDVDVSDTNVLGRTFNWREIIAISEDNSEDNELRKVLSKPGVYLQRSRDGKSRYVGAAYGEDGILGRWIHHLMTNGNAKHLNIFVLENGYANVLFTVLEFTFTDQATAAESRWKDTLGTRSEGPYDGFRLNLN